MTKRIKHNHFTRDIREPGECPACDIAQTTGTRTSQDDWRKKHKRGFERGISPITGTRVAHIMTDDPHEASDYFRELLRDSNEPMSLSIFSSPEDYNYDQAINILKKKVGPGKLNAIRFVLEVDGGTFKYCYIAVY